MPGAGTHPGCVVSRCVSGLLAARCRLRHGGRRVALVRRQDTLPNLLDRVQQLQAQQLHVHVHAQHLQTQQLHVHVHAQHLQAQQLHVDLMYMYCSYGHNSYMNTVQIKQCELLFL